MAFDRHPSQLPEPIPGSRSPLSLREQASALIAKDETVGHAINDNSSRDLSLGRQDPKQPTHNHVQISGSAEPIPLVAPLLYSADLDAASRHPESVSAPGSSESNAVVLDPGPSEIKPPIGELHQNPVSLKRKGKARAVDEDSDDLEDSAELERLRVSNITYHSHCRSFI